jgi:hypothetical protein
MTDTIRIDTGVKRILINGDEARVIEFNPQDTLFAERFYNLLKEFETKAGEFSARADELITDEVDEFGIPVNTGALLALTSEVCQYLRGQIDHVFGAGTSQAAFGGANTLNMFEQFFEGITPFIRQEREQKVKKYQAKK